MKALPKDERCILIYPNPYVRGTLTQTQSLVTHLLVSYVFPIKHLQQLFETRFICICEAFKRRIIAIIMVTLQRERSLLTVPSKTLSQMLSAPH